MLDWKDFTRESLARINDELCDCSSEEELELRAAAYGIDLDGDQVMKAIMYDIIIWDGMSPFEGEDGKLKRNPTRDEWDQMWECRTPRDAQYWVEELGVYDAETMLCYVNNKETDREHFMRNITARNNDVDPSELIAALDDA